MEENNPEHPPTEGKSRKRPRRRSPSPSDEEDFGEAEFVEDDFGEAEFVEDDVVVYHSKRFNKDFRFRKCVPGDSTKIAGAFEFWCLDCYALEKPEDVRATVKEGRFVWMDPDEPDRPHKCVLEHAGGARSEGPAKGPTTSSGGATKKRPKKASATTSKQGSVSNTPKRVDWLAPHRLPDDDDPPDDHGPVELDARGHLVFKSRVHAGATLCFVPRRAPGKDYYECRDCKGLFSRYSHHREVALSMRSITVVEGRISGRDPDFAGTSCGHLCQKRDVVDMIEANLKAKNEVVGKRRRIPAVAYEAGEVPAASNAQEGDGEIEDDIVFVEEVPGNAPQVAAPPITEKEEPRESPTPQNVASIESPSGLTPQSAQQRERQATTVPQKRVATVKNEVAEDVNADASTVPVTVEQGSGGGANGPPDPPAAGNPAPSPGNPFGGFRPVFGRAVPSGPTSVTFEGFADTYTFDLAKEGSRIMNGVRVPFKMYRCRECIKVMDRASHKLGVPCVIVVNGSFVERDPEFPVGADHFCSQDAA